MSLCSRVSSVLWSRRDVGGRVQYDFSKLDRLIALLWRNGLQPGEPRPRVEGVRKQHSGVFLMDLQALS